MSHLPTPKKNKQSIKKRQAMKNFFLSTIFISAFSFFSNAQLTKNHIISTSHPEPTKCLIDDIDQDGDNDLVISERSNNSIILFDNSDGLGDFQNRLTIGNASSISEMKSEDLDQDGDLDILCIQGNSAFKSLIWFENTGPQTDWVEHYIGNMGDVGLGALLVDVDQDGDLDLLSPNLSWFENLDNSTDFSSEQVILNDPQLLGDIDLIHPIDFDNDGDLDLVIYSEFQNESKIYWLERLSADVAFEDPQILVNSLSSFPLSFMQLTDIDLDNDLDILIHLGPNDVWLYKNESNLFTNAILISEFFDAPGGVAVSNVNHDGYPDFFWCGHPGVFWAENNQAGGFKSEIHKLGPSQSNLAVKDICFADLDGDMDKDLLSLGYEVSGFPQQIRWYENEYPLFVLNNNEKELSSIKLFPNPAYTQTITLHGVSVNQGFIYNLNGQRISTFHSNTINIKNLPNGNYCLRGVEQNGNEFTKMFIVNN